MHLELRNGIRTRQHGSLIVIGSIVVDPVKKKIVVLNAVSVDADQEILIQRVVPLRDVGSWRKGYELDEVAPVEWKLRTGLVEMTWPSDDVSD